MNEDANRIRGHVKFMLIRDLATGDLDTTQLAEKYDRPVQYIEGFAKRNAESIRIAREESADQYAGLWSANKAYRIAEYQQDVEEIDAYLARVEEPHEKLLARKQHALRMIAEELGQLKLSTDNKLDVTYRIEGVNPSDVV